MKLWKEILAWIAILTALPILLYGAGTSVGGGGITRAGLPYCASNGYVAQYSTTTHAWSCQPGSAVNFTGTTALTNAGGPGQLTWPTGGTKTTLTVPTGGGTLGTAAFTAASAYAPAAGSSSIVTVGTVTTGVWNGTTIKANYLQQAAADLGAADVTVNLSNSNGAFVTNLTIDGTLSALNVSGSNTGDITLAATNNGLGLTNQVITLGTPSSITGTSTNLVSTGTHTHALDLSAIQITAGSGTGVTVNSAGNLNREIYKVTATYQALSSLSSLTADKVIATLPAKTRLVSIITDTTIPYTGGTVSAATLQVGKTTGGVEYMAVHDVLSGAVTRGLADADLGTSMVRAAAVQGGDLPSWSGTTNISVRLTTVTDTTDHLTAGSTTYYLITERY